jgi:hypothetical protein
MSRNIGKSVKRLPINDTLTSQKRKDTTGTFPAHPKTGEKRKLQTE